MGGSVLPTTDELQLQKVTVKAGLRQKVTRPSVQPGNTALNHGELSSVCFDEACNAMGWALDKQVQAELAKVRIVISTSVIARWRNPHAKESPSLAVCAALGSEFMRVMKRSYGRRFGWGRVALLDALNAFGEVVEEMEA
jgi:hypothetical protein